MFAFPDVSPDVAGTQHMMFYLNITTIATGPDFVRTITVTKSHRACAD